MDLGLIQAIDMLELTESLNSFQHRAPGKYLLVVSIVALGGFLMFLLLPLLGLKFLLDALITLYAFTIESGNITPLLYQLPLPASLLYLSYRFFSVKLDTPRPSDIYVSINKKKTPKLVNLITDLEQYFKIKPIDKIIITDQYDISVHVTPKFSFPSLYTTTLLIGLPVMQTVSAKQFKALLARRVGQLTFKHNKLTGSLYFFNDCLAQYSHFFKSNRHWSYQVFGFAFNYYYSFFNAVSFYARRMEELSADENAIALVDGKSFSQTLAQILIAQHYLKNNYSRLMYKLQRQYPDKLIFPHANMAVSYTKNTDSQTAESLLKNEFQRITNFKTSTPLLRTRLEKLGHKTISLPLPLENTAAMIYLDKALPRITKIFDKLWQQKIQAKEDHDINSNANDERRQFLLKKITEQALSAEETWELAVLTEKLSGYQAAIPIYRKIIERNPMHSKAIFAIGRILLSYNDETGISAIEKAVFLEPAMRKTADELIARYHARVQQTTDSDEAYA